LIERSDKINKSLAGSLHRLFEEFEKEYVRDITYLKQELSKKDDIFAVELSKKDIELSKKDDIFAVELSKKDIELSKKDDIFAVELSMKEQLFDLKLAMRDKDLLQSRGTCTSRGIFEYYLKDCQVELEVKGVFNARAVCNAIGSIIISIFNFHFTLINQQSNLIVPAIPMWLQVLDCSSKL
jgi:hypothetical protein